jgi:flagellar hook-length control protein FliK
MKIRTDFLNSPTAAQFTGNASASANTMSNFASLLQQQSRAPALAPPPPPPPVATASAKASPATPEASSDSRNAENSAGNESTEAADQAAPDESANKPRPATKPRARQADAQAPARAAREETTTARHDKAAAADDDASATPADPKTPGDGTTPAWLASLMAPPATTPSATALAQRSSGLAEVAEGSETLPGDAEAAGNAVGATRGRTMSAGARKADAREALDAAEVADRGSASSSKEAASSLPGFAAVLAEQRHTDAGPHRDAATPSIDGARGALASSAPVAGSVSQDAASTSNAHVRAAVGSPEFPQELGVQLSVLARDGIQKAELHLNPAEMGPVSVQIVMDGTQARVDFGADVAATRHAIEAGLPELASALRDAGFTLAGGGVSQHAGGRQGSDGTDGERARRDGGASRSGVSAVDGGDSTSRVVRTRVSAGGVDLYA